MAEDDVRRANVNDIPNIDRIIEKNNAIPDRPYTASQPLSRDSAVVNERQAVFVALTSTNVIGYLNLHWNKQNSERRHEAEFEVVVDPECRLSGAGRKLLTEAIKYIAEKTEVETVVAKIKNGNLGSERLCTKLGFIKAHQDDLGAYWELNVER